MDKPNVNQHLLDAGILSRISLNRVAKKIRGDVLALLAQLRDQLTGQLNRPNASSGTLSNGSGRYLLQHEIHPLEDRVQLLNRLIVVSASFSKEPPKASDNP